MRVEVKGTIVSNDSKWLYDWFDMESTAPKDVSSKLQEANGEDIELIINSGGGEIFSASEIYTELKSYQGNVTAKIVGLAASAASVIAMSGKKILMSPTSQMMIHNVSVSCASGDCNDMEHYAEQLRTANDTIANAYEIKTKKDKKELLDLMNQEKWFSADEALKEGFIDEVMFKEAPTLVNSVGFILPENISDKVRKNDAELKKLRLENAQLKLSNLKNGGSK